MILRCLLIWMIATVGEMKCAATTTPSFDFNDFFTSLIECNDKLTITGDQSRRRVQTNAVIIQEKDELMDSFVKELKYLLKRDDPVVMVLGNDSEDDETHFEDTNRVTRAIPFEQSPTDVEARSNDDIGSFVSTGSAGNSGVNAEGRQRRRRRKNKRKKTRRNRCRSAKCIRRRRRRNQLRRRKNKIRRRKNRTKRSVEDDYLSSVVAELHGISSIKKRGSVRVETGENSHHLQTDVALGPLILRIVREEEDLEYEEAQLITADLNGILSLNQAANGKSFASLKLDLPLKISTSGPSKIDSKKITDPRFRGIFHQKIVEKANYLLSKMAKTS